LQNKITPILLAAGLILLSCKADKAEHIETLSEEQLALLREGDFVLRLGYGLVSYTLEMQGGSVGVSHIGVLVKDSADFEVIHSISGSMAELDGVQKISLEDFLQEARPNSLIAVRFKNSNEKLITNEARRLLAARVPFDLSFDLKDTTKLFCSEFIDFILRKTHNTTVFSPEEDGFPFSVFLDTSKFEILVDNRIR